MRTDVGTPGRSEVAEEHIRRLAGELLPDAERIALEVVAPVLVEVPEVAPAGPSVAERSTHQNIAAMLATLAGGLDPTAFAPPPATLDLVLRIVDHGGDLDAVLRGYRVGHRRFWELWAEHAGRGVEDRDELQAVLGASSSTVFALFDSVLAGVVAFHRAELERRAAAEPRHGSRAAAVEAVLAGGPVDLDSTSTVLGYDLRGHHVAVVVAPVDVGDGGGGIGDGLDADRGVGIDRGAGVGRAAGVGRSGGIDRGAGVGGGAGRAAEDLAARLGRPRTLMHPVGDGTVLAWFGWSGTPDEEVLAGAARLGAADGRVAAGGGPRPGGGSAAGGGGTRGDGVSGGGSAGGGVTSAPADVVIALGEPGQGLDGLRRSHEQALEALRVRRMRADPRPGVVRHRDVALAAILCADPERARTFATACLGALAADDGNTARLRDTLRTFYACGQNKARTAELLFVHQRTVSYRMARAASLLVRDVEGDAADLQAALLVLETLGAG
ncbi:PucR family transcriptional regulator [Patulibacter minatonensis]|uniref:PucR family transcriptional regulator n=1 Tax=Patulibacter minatonensis TaxID=298163 RepID=UPI000478EB36|nr:helix-turn-helix domain-containing protein [Patulibacter minatonensis]